MSLGLRNPSPAIDGARNADLLTVAREVGATLRREGREWIGPCPSCGGVDRFSINPVKGVFNCRGSGGGDAIALVQHTLGRSFLESCQWITGKAIEPAAEPRRVGMFGASRSRVPAPVDPSPVALDYWRQAVPIEETPAEAYLTRWRGLLGPFPPSLRFHPSALHPILRRPFPAMVAGLSSEDQQPVSVQLCYLGQDGNRLADKPNARRTFGGMGGAAVRLGAAGDTLGLAEGVETALSVAQLYGVTCWATCGAQRFASVAFPSTVRHVVIFADDDEKGTSVEAAQKAAATLRADGFGVTIRIPPQGFKDYNDVLRGTRNQMAAA